MPRGVKALAFGLAALAGSLAVQMPAQAHHSFAATYNMDMPLEITGTINNVRLTNPHSHFFIDVTGDERPLQIEWALFSKG